jgi:hypothetical protein
MINRCLPDEIRVLGWSPVSDGFSSRFSCVSRTYRYFFHASKLNITAMRGACSYLLGIHDFRNICKLDVANVTNFVREIYSADIVLYQENKEDLSLSLYMLEIKGIAFLWHMVRCIMSLLFLIGEEKESPGIIIDLFDLEKCPAKPSYSMADDYPLVLHECSFENLILYRQPKILWNLCQHYSQVRNKLLIQAAEAQNALDYLSKGCSVREKDLMLFYEYLSSQKEKLTESASSKRSLDKIDNGDVSKKRKYEEIKSEGHPITQPHADSMISWNSALEQIKETTGFTYNHSFTKHVPLLKVNWWTSNFILSNSHFASFLTEK